MPRGLGLVGEAVLEAAARAVEAEAKRGEGVAERQTQLQLSGLGNVRRGGKRGLLPDTTGRFHMSVVTLDVEKVAPGAERTNAEGAEGTAGDIPATPMCMALLRWVVDKQAAAAIVTVASCVVAPTQLRFVFWMVEWDVQLMQAMCKLAALTILAEASGGVAGAELRLVTGGTDPGDQSWRGGGFHLRKESLCQGDSYAITLRLLIGQQGIHHFLVLV